MRSFKALVAAMAVACATPAVASTWQEVVTLKLSENQILQNQSVQIAPDLQIATTRVLRTYEGGCSAKPLIGVVGYANNLVDPFGNPVKIQIPMQKVNSARDPRGLLGDQFELINNGQAATPRELIVSYTPIPRPIVGDPQAPCTLHVYVQVD